MTNTLVLLMLALSSLGEGKGFLKRSASDIRMDVQAVQQELHEALRGALGRGHGVDHKQISVANATLLPMFQSLPKNEHGRVGAAAMRYAVQRYFSKNHGWIIKGFESHNTQDQVQDSGILESKVPGYVEAILEEKLQKGGYALPDILTVVIVVERLIFDEVARSVENAYHLNHVPTESLLKQDSLITVLESHLIVEMLERHEFDEQTHKEDRAEILDLYPNWNSLKEFLTDIVATESCSVLQSGAQNPFSRVGVDVFSFDDAVRIAQRMANEYGRWGNQECMELRSFLSDNERSSTGRLPLTGFYKLSEVDDRWSFQETPEYLRELGALDDSSKALGPRVIISNYAYGMSNCLSSTPFYSVCCLNECEGLLQQIEIRLAKPSASPMEILTALELVQMTSFAVNTSQFSSELLTTLEQIAANSNGKVPLHGRLFAQWLHYAFPNECPFPHVAGSVKPQTQGERLSKGEEIFVDAEELAKHLQQEEKQRSEGPSEAREDELWSWDEELLHEPAPEPRAQGRRASRFSGAWVGILAMGILVVVWVLNSTVATASKNRMLMPKKELYV